MLNPADRKLQEHEVDALLALYNVLNNGPALTPQQCAVLRTLGFIIEEPLELDSKQLPQA